MKTAWMCLSGALVLTICSGWSAVAACIDVRRANSLIFEGTLTYRIFAGSPNFEDVRHGDAPEPGYILKLDDPVCATGDEFLDPNESIDRIQVFPDDSTAAGQALVGDLRRMIGRRVSVEGKNAYGAFTGHHHAPLLMTLTRIMPASDPYLAYGTSMTTVQASANKSVYAVVALRSPRRCAPIHLSTGCPECRSGRFRRNAAIRPKLKAKRTRNRWLHPFACDRKRLFFTVN